MCRTVNPFALVVAAGFVALVASVASVASAAPAAPANSAAAAAPVPELFVSADQCQACHNGLVASDGGDVSIGFDWRSSIMAHSARDPYWQAAVRREVMDHPAAQAAIEDECAICHLPMARFEAHAQGQTGEIFAHLPPAQPGAAAAAGDPRTNRLALDGVSCSACHQIQAAGLGTEESFTGGFVVATERPLWSRRPAFGPHDVDAGRTRVMHSATGLEPVRGDHIQDPELCATCHTLYTHALGPDGEVVGTLPEQVPYLEWRHSDFAESRSCQSCHMPALAGLQAPTSVLPQPREEFSPHVFRGGNFFVLSMLNRYRDELAVAALPQELARTRASTMEFLRTEAATLAVDSAGVADGHLTARLQVENLAGHKLPTAYPSRRVWLHVTVRDGRGAVFFESGALEPSGLIVGNDNDRDPDSYEHHHRTITDPEQVQIYESIMMTRDGRVTTGLLSAVGYVKDNRIVPEGFDKTTAGEDIAVQGAARDDGDFVGGLDRVRYRVEVGDRRGPFTLTATLWYQPISFRWAMNQEPYDAPETRRFTRMYRSMSESSAIVLARTSARVATSD
ncbi:MAG: hypothetical protein R6X25_13880 [Candidatus Krumholzibacteriia bacterium]